eukprot:14059660-Heterocapsa_arctica.AAC.1
MRTPKARTPGYVPPWVTRADGSRARPTSLGDVLLGARQEWEQLLHEPEVGWAHSSFRPWTDAAGRSRVSLSADTVALAPVGSSARVLASVVWGPSPCRVITWKDSEVSVVGATDVT